MPSQKCTIKSLNVIFWFVSVETQIDWCFCAVRLEAIGQIRSYGAVWVPRGWRPRGGRCRWIAPGDLFERFGGGPRLYPHHQERPRRVLQRDCHLIGQRPCSQQVSQQAQPIVRYRRSFPGRTRWKDWPWWREGQWRSQGKSSIHLRDFREGKWRWSWLGRSTMGTRWFAKDLGFRAWHIWTQLPDRWNQGGTILERNQRQFRVRFPMGHERGENYLLT